MLAAEIAETCVTKYDDTDSYTHRRMKTRVHIKLAFHGADTDTDTDFLADILARIVARMSACR